MLRKVTHCAGRILANTRLRWGDRKMGTHMHTHTHAHAHTHTDLVSGRLHDCVGDLEPRALHSTEERTTDIACRVETMGYGHLTLRTHVET